MGDMLILTVPKERIDVKISVFANPHNPLIKNAATAAMIHKNMFYPAKSELVYK